LFQVYLVIILPYGVQWSYMEYVRSNLVVIELLVATNGVHY